MSLWDPDGMWARPDGFTIINHRAYFADIGDYCGGCRLETQRQADRITSFWAAVWARESHLAAINEDPAPPRPPGPAKPSLLGGLFHAVTHPFVAAGGFVAAQPGPGESHRHRAQMELFG